MCGICGVFGAADARERLSRMRGALAHRGPDDEGEYFDGPIGLGFRRLSILDLENGHQPMSSIDGAATLVFNGEIYNHPELRRELAGAGVRFKTRSDTETILSLYLREGLAAFSRLDGMFAIGLWDREARRLVLARDGLGIKPLYYRFDGAILSFSSELRSLLAGGGVGEVDAAALREYLAYGKVHAPRTILSGALKLPAGHVLTLDGSGLSLKRFWSPRPKRSAAKPPGAMEALDQLDDVLSESVRASLLSDVPVGCFLSGGVDSSLVAAYMVRHSGGKTVHTFSVGFDGAAAGVDESRFARLAARHLGTEHHELRLPADVLSRLEDSIDLLDEPIADSAILPTFLLSRFARQRVKAVLTGEGADELFAGYDRHKAAWLNERLRALPGWSRASAAALARRAGKGRVFAGLPYGDLGQWAAATASARPGEVAALLHPDLRAVDGAEAALGGSRPLERLEDALAFDLETVLADSLLMKVDKSAMRAGLEARVPFLNRSVVEFALGLPASFKIRRFKGKYLLRLLAERHLPRELAWRRKHGFIVPWERWVRDPGNETLRRLLEGPSLARLGLFDCDRLRRMREALCAGSREFEPGLLFRVAILGLWLESLA